MIAEHRARLLRRIYLFAPLVAAVGGVVVAESGLADFVQKHMPASLGGYTDQAMNLAPFSWLVLALGCAVGSCLDRARQKGATGWALAFWLGLFIPLVFVAQAVVCTGIAVGGCMLVVGMPH